MGKLNRIEYAPGISGYMECGQWLYQTLQRWQVRYGRCMQGIAPMAGVVWSFYTRRYNDDWRGMVVGLLGIGEEAYLTKRPFTAGRVYYPLWAVSLWRKLRHLCECRSVFAGRRGSH